MARGLEDFSIRADWDPASGRGTLAVQTTGPARLTVPELGLAWHALAAVPATFTIGLSATGPPGAVADGGTTDRSA